MEPANIRQETSAIWEKLIQPAYRAHLFDEVSTPLIIHDLHSLTIFLILVNYPHMHMVYDYDCKIITWFSVALTFGMGKGIAPSVSRKLYFEGCAVLGAIALNSLGGAT